MEGMLKVQYIFTIKVGVMMHNYAVLGAEEMRNSALNFHCSFFEIL